MRNNNHNIVLTQHTFFVDRTIFSNTFPELRGDALRVYLLMCRVVGANNGKFFMSIKQISQEVNISEHHVKKALKFLCDTYFIKYVGKRKQSNVYIVLSVPDYHKFSNTYYSNENINRDRFNMKDNLNGYCELPVKILEGSILRDKSKWTDIKIKVLGQLYMYHWIDEYGGVDPEAFHYNKSTVVISDLVARTIDFHKNNIKKVVSFLIREGCAFKVKTVYRENQNSCNREMQYIGDLTKVSPIQNDGIKEIIRLKLVPDLKLKDAIVRTGGNIEF